MSGIDNLAASICDLIDRVMEGAEEVAFMFGVVIDTAPLTVQVEQRLILPEELLILTDAVIADVEQVENPEDKSAVIYRVFHNLSNGDRVLLAKIQGGEAYVILSRCYQVVA